MEYLAVASVSLIVGFLFGMWFYWKVLLPYFAKRFLKERDEAFKAANPKAHARKQRQKEERENDRLQ